MLFVDNFSIILLVEQYTFRLAFYVFKQVHLITADWCIPTSPSQSQQRRFGNNFGPNSELNRTSCS